MDPVFIATCIGLLTTALVASWWKIFNMGLQIGKLQGAAEENRRRSEDAQYKADTMISFQRRRSMVKAVNQGKVVPNLGNFKVTPEWRERYKPLMPTLTQWYEQEGRRLSPNDQFVSLEAKHGDEIVETICKPHGVDDGECLAMAILLCHETQIA